MGAAIVSADISSFKGVRLYNGLGSEASDRVAGEAEVKKYRR